MNRNLTAPVTGASEIPTEKAAENRPIIQAVKALNGTEMFGHDNQLTFQRDPESKRMVLQVINRNTHEVVSQIPPEYVLRLAEDLKPQQDSGPPARIG
ncbi:MAG: flagellar protein FlaG [Acidobacteriia bacterium]|nr:flagellar protein FlaG [Terriglobia bacterium]